MSSLSSRRRFLIALWLLSSVRILRSQTDKYSSVDVVCRELILFYRSITESEIVAKFTREV
jgi:hypothetical protein